MNQQRQNQSNIDEDLIQQQLRNYQNLNRRREKTIYASTADKYQGEPGAENINASEANLREEITHLVNNRNAPNMIQSNSEYREDNDNEYFDISGSNIFYTDKDLSQIPRGANDYMHFNPSQYGGQDQMKKNYGEYQKYIKSQTLDKIKMQMIQKSHSDKENQTVDKAKEQASADKDSKDHIAVISQRSASNNKKLYMQNYSIQYKLPSLYVLDALVIPRNKDYVVQLCKIVIPDSSKKPMKSFSRSEISQSSLHFCEYEKYNQYLKVITYYQDKKKPIQFQEFEEVQAYSKFRNGLILRLLKRKGNQLSIDQTCFFKNTNKAIMKISHCAKYLAIYFHEDETFKIYKLHSNLNQTMVDIEQQNYFVFFNNKVIQNQQRKQSSNQTKQDLSFIKNLEFDKKGQFIIGYGSTKMFLLNLASSRGKVHTIDEIQYEEIKDILFDSSNSTLHNRLACKMKNIKKIKLFEYNFNQQANKNNDKEEGKNNAKPNIIQKSKIDIEINYVSDTSNRMIIQISKDLNSIFFANEHEIFIIEIINGVSVKELLPLKKQHLIRFVWPDPENLKAFYYICGMDYGKNLIIVNTHDKAFKFKIACQLEPDMFKIYDINISQIAQQQQTNENRTIVQKELSLVRISDDNFQNAQIVFQEVNHPNLDSENKAAQRLTGFNSQLQQQKQKEKLYQNIKTKYYEKSAFGAVSIKWPYIAFAGISNFLMIYNAYDGSVIQRIQVAEDDKEALICETFITNTNDLFIVTFEDPMYKVYFIDLDQANLSEVDEDDENLEFDFKKRIQEKYRLNKPILEYDSKSVEGKELNQFHVRGSSRKELVDINQLLQAFFLHGDTIYCLKSFGDQILDRQQKLQKVVKIASRTFQWLGDSELFYVYENRDEDNNLINQEIQRIKINFSNFQISAVCREAASISEKIITINIDQIQQNFIIVTKMKTDSNENEYRFKVFNMKSMKCIFESIIENEILIGRMKSDLFTFEDGYIYYNNNVIKIRYDLINSINSQKYKEDDIFDYYFNIFYLEENYKVNSKTPLASLTGHRFAYITTDSTLQEPKYLLLTPFLHDRKIYLNRIKYNTNYFYTSRTTSYEELLKYEKSLMTKLSPDGTKVAKDNKNNNQLDKNYFNQEFTGRMSEQMKNKFQNNQKVTSIIGINQTEKKYYVYSENGLLMNRINYSKIIEKYGEPLQTLSNNGLNWILKKNYEDIIKSQKPNISQKEILDELWTVHIFSLSIFQLQFIKKINILESIKHHFENNEVQQYNGNFITFDEFQNNSKNDWIFKQNCKEIHENVRLKFHINDKMDICIRIRHKVDEERQIEELEKFKKKRNLKSNNIFMKEDVNKTVYNTIYYYEQTLPPDTEEKTQKIKMYFGKNKKSDKNQNIQELESNIFITDQHKHTQYNISKNIIFFWDRFKIWMHDLNEVWIEENKLLCDFYVEECEKESHIKEVRTSSDPKTVAIIVCMSPNNDTILIWNTLENFERESFDVGKDYEMLWDNEGNAYIIFNDKIIFTNESCITNVFDYQNLEDVRKVQSKISLQKGHRFNSENHNWLIFQEYLSLPFSYLTFVIKDNIEQNGYNLEGNVFDVEPYNYIFNKRSAFLDGQLTMDHKQLQWVLQNFLDININLIEQLNYYQNLGYSSINEGEQEPILATALHIALQKGNQRSVEILLNYMSKMQMNSPGNFRSIFDKLIDYTKFYEYLRELPNQTLYMERLQVLKVYTTLTDKIVSMQEASNIALNENSLCHLLGQVDDTENRDDENMIKSYPVKVVAMNVGWILNTASGKKFLQETLRNEDLDFFLITSLQITIEFLSRRFKKIVLKYYLPLYIVQFIAYQCFVNYLELYNKQVHLDNINTIDYEQIPTVNEQNYIDEFENDLREYTQKQLFNLVVIFGLVNIFITILMLSYNIFIFIKMKKNYLRRFYSWVDILFIVQNFILVVNIVSEYYQSPIVKISKFEENQINLRLLEVAGTLLQFSKLTYFFALVDAFAPLIDIIIKIFWDIIFFMLLMTLLMACLTLCFQTIANNQWDFDELSQDEKDMIGYREYTGAFWYVFDIVIGDAGRDSFDLGKGSMSWILQLLWIVGIFMVQIHLLNMLIAIMGNTFTERNVVGQQIMTRDHLKFVMDNYHLMNFVFQNVKRVKYIVTAYSASEMDSTDSQILNDINQRLEGMTYQSQQNHNDLLKKLKDITSMMELKSSARNDNIDLH